MSFIDIGVELSSTIVLDFDLDTPDYGIAILKR